MKKIYLILFSAILLTNLIKAQAPPEIIHYNFNGTGTLVPNFASAPPVGTANGTIMAGMTQGVATGQCGFALSGTGSSGTTDYVNTNWTTNLSGSWSIAFWTASITPSSTLWYILGDNSAGSFRCFTNGAAGANNWLLRATGMTDMIVTGGAVMAATHNAFVYDAANSKGVWYLNGVQQGTVTQSSAATFVGTGPFKVGAYASNNNLNGLMDEFRLYSRALTPTEVAQIAQGSPTSNNLTISSCGPYTSPSTNSVYPLTGTYTETYTSCGGTSTNNINLTVNPVPTLTITASSANVCSGTTVNITSTGNVTTYTWNGTGPNTSSIAVIPASTTIYTLVASNGGACNATRTININVSATPSMAITSSGNGLCYGQSISLTASGAGTYSWNTGATTASITGTPLTNTNYIVTGTSGTCSSTQTVAVTVSPSPTVTLSPGASTTICNGQSLVLTGSGANNYAWSNGAFVNSITVSPATNTVYSVTGISNNCVDTKSITVTVDPSPTVSVVSSTNTICSNSLVTLTASGANSYSWSTGDLTNPTTITPLVTGVYTVTGTTANCSRSATININVIQGPVITITPASPTVCSGVALTLNATGAFSYTWDANNNGNVYTAYPTANTTYTVVGKLANVTCLSTATIAVTVNPNPTVTASSNKAVICKGEKAVITAAGGLTYAWSASNVTTNTLSVNPTSTKAYTITGTDANGCSADAVVTQTVNACIGINEIAGNTSLNIYPNPSSGIFNVELMNAGAKTHVEIYTGTGQLLLKKELKNGSASIDLSSYASGIYYLKISGDNNEFIKLFKD